MGMALDPVAFDNVSGTDLGPLALAGNLPPVFPLADIYDGFVGRQLLNQSVHVNLLLTFAILTELDDREQTAHWLISYVLLWEDSALKHNLSSPIYTKNFHRWQPDVAMMTSIETLRNKMFESGFIIDQSGTVTQEVLTSVKTICPIVTKQFPFDTQTCELDFETFAPEAVQHLRGDVLYPRQPGMFSGNDEWLMSDITVSFELQTIYGITYPRNVFSVVLQRRGLFFITTIVLPTWVITSIALLGIFMACADSVEKIRLALEVLLALVFTMTMLSDFMPKAANVPILGVLLLEEFGLIFVSTCVAFTLNQIGGQLSKRKNSVVNFIVRNTQDVKKRKARLVMVLSTVAVCIAEIINIVFFVVFLSKAQTHWRNVTRIGDESDVFSP